MGKFLEKLNELQGKKAKIVLSDNEEVICRPIQYLEEEYESYVVEVSEETLSYPPKYLLELEEHDILSVKKITQ